MTYTRNALQPVMSMKPEGYRPRLIEKELDMKMGMYGTVCIEGPRACGKTWTGLSRAESAFGLDDPADNHLNYVKAQTDVRSAFDGPEPRLIDEWQGCPRIWDTAKSITDRSTEKGRFILTGSSTPASKGVMHDGTGRIGTVRMRPMSLFESGDSKGTVSLSGLFDGRFGIDEPSRNTLEKLVGLTVRGGWPMAIGLSEKQCVRYSRGYLAEAIRSASVLDGADRNESKMRALVRALARNESGIVSNSALSEDTRNAEDDGSGMRNSKSGLSEQTVPVYMSALERVFVVDNQPAFSFGARPSVRMAKNPKRHLVDPSLSIAALELTPKDLMADLRTYRPMFESMCFRDLRIYAESRGGSVSHYRDDRGKEIDAIIQNYEGEYGAVEIKLGEGQVDEAAENMLKLRKRFENDGLPLPKFMCVVCGTAAGSYRRPDGVYVVPITHLRD